MKHSNNSEFVNQLQPDCQNYIIREIKELAYRS